MNLFITGGSGYIGRFIFQHLFNKFDKIILLINSEKRFKENEFLYENCIIYKGDIGDKNLIKEIFQDNKIDYVIHAAAMKYIDTCQKFQRQCIETNIIGTLNVCEYAKKYNVKNVLTISTDKANNPGCLYGVSKLTSEIITLSHGFNVYQGVNFWNSDGSFLQKWKTAITNKEPVILYDNKHIRYFSEPNETANEILDLVLNCNNKINYPSRCFKVKILDVFNILKEKYKDHNFICKKSEENEFDKIEEEINELTKVEEISFEKLKILIDLIFL